MKIVVVIEGGLVQSVLSDAPAELVIIDYDTEGSAAEEGVVQMPQRPDGTAPAFVSLGATEVDEAEVQSIFNDAQQLQVNGLLDV